MGYQPQTCYNNLLNAKKHPCPSDMGGRLAFHCQSVAKSLHEFCASKDVYYPLNWNEIYNIKKCSAGEYHPEDPTKCDTHVFASLSDSFNWVQNQPNPQDWKSRDCDCCCACFAYGTPVAISEKDMKVIENFIIGDEVLAGSVEVKKGGRVKLEWKKGKIEMSEGSPSQPSGYKSYPDAIYLNYGEGLELICTLDQVFLLSSGKFKHASQLTLQDELTAPDGTFVEINSIKVAQYSGGIHHIATSTRPVKNPDGHLLNTNGVVTGDYSLQISTQALGDQLETGPYIGSKEYDDLHKNRMKGIFHYTKEVDSTENTPKELHLYVKGSSLIPELAASFIGLEQAIELDANATFRPPFDPVNSAVIQDLFRMFNAFYPDINFFLDNTNLTPNAYAFESYGVKQVVISGKMARVDTIYWEGIALILAQCVASFELNEYGRMTDRILPRAEADLFSTKNVIRTVFPFTKSELFEAAITQVTALFSCIQTNQGNPEHPKRNPSLSCREDTFMAGNYGGQLPECAGGKPVVISFMVVWAKYDAVTKKITVAFNADIDLATGESIENYSFTPEVVVKSAKISFDKKQVELECDLKEKSDYLVVVDNVKSTSGKEVLEGNNYARFSTK